MWSVKDHLYLVKSVKFTRESESLVPIEVPLTWQSVYTDLVDGKSKTEVTLKGRVSQAKLPSFEVDTTFDFVAPCQFDTPHLIWYGVKVTCQENGRLGRYAIGLHAPGDHWGIGLVYMHPNKSKIGGLFRNVNLINTLVYTDGAKGKKIHNDTKGQYWYDGAKLPYGDVIPIAPGSSKNHDLVFNDLPCFLPHQNEKREDPVITYNARFRIYFIYQSRQPNAAPVTLGYPVQWEYRFQAKRDKAAHPEASKVLNSAFTPCSGYKNVDFSEWSNNTKDLPDLEAS